MKINFEFRCETWSCFRKLCNITNCSQHTHGRQDINISTWHPSQFALRANIFAIRRQLRCRDKHFRILYSSEWSTTQRKWYASLSCEIGHIHRDLYMESLEHDFILTHCVIEWLTNNMGRDTCKIRYKVRNKFTTKNFHSNMPGHENLLTNTDTRVDRQLT